MPLISHLQTITLLHTLYGWESCFQMYCNDGQAEFLLQAPGHVPGECPSSWTCKQLPLPPPVWLGKLPAAPCCVVMISMWQYLAQAPWQDAPFMHFSECPLPRPCKPLPLSAAPCFSNDRWVAILHPQTHTASSLSLPCSQLLPRIWLMAAGAYSSAVLSTLICTLKV